MEYFFIITLWFTMILLVTKKNIFFLNFVKIFIIKLWFMMVRLATRGTPLFKKFQFFSYDSNLTQQVLIFFTVRTLFFKICILLFGYKKVFIVILFLWGSKTYPSFVKDSNLRSHNFLKCIGGFHKVSKIFLSKNYSPLTFTKTLRLNLTCRLIVDLMLLRIFTMSQLHVLNDFKIFIILNLKILFFFIYLIKLVS